MNEPYRIDLAFIHDEGFTGFARKAARAILQLFRQSGIQEGLIVDLGCGSGVWASILASEGYRVHGVDLSQAMIDLARKRVPEASFETCSFLKATIPDCAAVTSMGECLNYLFDEDHSPSQLSGLFERIYRALPGGGVFVFDVAGPGYAAATGPHRRHFLSDDWAVLVQLSEHDGLLTRYITSFRKTSGNHYRRDEETHRVRLLDAAQLAETLRRTGFNVHIRKGYGNFELSPAHHVLIARKPTA